VNQHAKYPSETADKFVVRLPDGMRERIKDKASRNHRTMNAEILHVLDRALAADETKDPASVKLKPATVAKEPWPITIGQAAHALYVAVLTLRATPRYPENHAAITASQEAFDEAVSDMRRALENA
jgi:plasmid stability protein